jgi:hypothetical protein
MGVAAFNRLLPATPFADSGRATPAMVYGPQILRLAAVEIPT